MTWLPERSLGRLLVHKEAVYTFNLVVSESTEWDNKKGHSKYNTPLLSFARVSGHACTKHTASLLTLTDALR